MVYVYREGIGDNHDLRFLFLHIGHAEGFLGVAFQDDGWWNACILEPRPAFLCTSHAGLTDTWRNLVGVMLQNVKIIRQKIVYNS